MARMTKKEQHGLWEKLRSKRLAMEELDLIKAYRAWLTLPTGEQDRIKATWDDHYQRVLETQSYRDFQAMRKALKLGQMAKVRSIATQARRRLAEGSWELVKPTEPDPYVFVYDSTVIAYQNLVKRMEQIVTGEMAISQDMADIFL